MPVMLERWNDDKMDALATTVGGVETQLREHRRETREDIRELRGEMTGLRGEMKELRGEMTELRREMNEGFERVGRTMAQGAFGLAGSMVVGFAAVVATQL